MCIFRALFIDVLLALIMNCSHILKEQESLIFTISVFVYAFLAQVFHDNFLATQVISVVCSAISSTSEAVSANELVTAIHALPVDEVGTHQYFVAKLFVNFLEVLYEVEN